MAPLKRLIFILLIGFTGMFIAGKIADKGYLNFWHPFRQKMDVAFKDSTYYDLLYLGNSTVNFGINPYYIDSITKLNTYNFGYGGATIETISTMLYGYIQNHPKPKAIVLSMGYASFSPGIDESNYFLFFYYLQNQSVANYLKQQGYKIWLLKRVPFLKYCYFDDYSRDNAVNGLFDSSLFEKNAVVYKGFINNKFDSVTAANVEADEKIAVDTTRVKIFYTLLDYCQQQNIKILVIYPPRFYLSAHDKSYNTGTSTDNIIQNAVIKYHIPFKRFDDTGMFPQNDFSDKIHLNIQGSKKYSIMLGRYIDSCLSYINQ